MWNVILLGLVSFFSDISAEMVYPIIPLYLTSTFGATPILIGLIEGIESIQWLCHGQMGQKKADCFCRICRWTSI